MSSSEAAGAQPRVAVLGAGTMGSGMAHSLLRAGFPVDVWNRTPEPAAQPDPMTPAPRTATLAVDRRSKKPLSPDIARCCGWPPASQT